MMLVAENHGKVVLEAQSSEDLLTSAVFGQLRFIPPNTFWQALLDTARLADRDEQSLLTEIGEIVSDYKTLEMYFWKSHREFGEPDLILKFHGGNTHDLILLIEVKYHSSKHGCGSADQLVKYFHLLSRLHEIDGITVSPTSKKHMVYLTPRDSRLEVKESLSSIENTALFPQKIFRLRWQDILQVAQTTVRKCEFPSSLILEDVSLFLEKRGLKYFDGFKKLEQLEQFYKSPFYTPICKAIPSPSLLTSRFIGMQQIHDLPAIFPIKGLGTR